MASEKGQDKDKKKHKKEKKIRVFTWGFFFSLLMVAAMSFFICFSYGLNNWRQIL